MAETPEPMQRQPEADPATLAFEALREEVALVRRAVAGLAAERASIEIPAQRDAGTDHARVFGNQTERESAGRNASTASFGQRLEPRNRDGCPRSSPFRPASVRRGSTLI